MVPILQASHQSPGHPTPHKKDAKGGRKAMPDPAHREGSDLRKLAETTSDDDFMGRRRIPDGSFWWVRMGTYAGACPCPCAG